MKTKTPVTTVPQVLNLLKILMKQEVMWGRDATKRDAANEALSKLNKA